MLRNVYAKALRYASFEASEASGVTQALEPEQGIVFARRKVVLLGGFRGGGGHH